MNDELDLDALTQVTGGKNFLTAEEEANIYRNYSGKNARDMVNLLNQKKALEDIKQQETGKDFSGGRNK